VEDIKRMAGYDVNRDRCLDVHEMEAFVTDAIQDEIFYGVSLS